MYAVLIDVDYGRLAVSKRVVSGNATGRLMAVSLYSLGSAACQDIGDRRNVPVLCDVATMR